MGPNRFIGFIINDFRDKKVSVYLNTTIKTYDEIHSKLISSSKVLNLIESEIPDFLIKWAETIEMVLQGEDQDTSRIPLDLSDYTEKQAKVIQTVHQQIPVNDFKSYSEIAEMAEYPNAQRFVGSTMKKCRQYPIIPCHRIKKTQWIKRHNKQTGQVRTLNTLKTPL